MADTILSIDDLNKLFQGVTLGILYPEELADWLEYEAADPKPDTVPSNPYYNVRVSYQGKGQSAWLITEDVASIYCYEVDDPYNRNRDQIIDDVDDEARISTSYTRVINCQWVFYGPESYSNARLVLDRLFSQSIRDILAASNLYMIKDAAAPKRIPEPFQGQWWERADLNVRFNELVTREDTRHWVESAEIEIHDKDGLQRTVDVTEST